MTWPSCISLAWPNGFDPIALQISQEMELSAQWLHSAPFSHHHDFIYLGNRIPHVSRKDVKLNMDSMSLISKRIPADPPSSYFFLFPSVSLLSVFPRFILQQSGEQEEMAGFSIEHAVFKSGHVSNNLSEAFYCKPLLCVSGWEQTHRALSCLIDLWTVVCSISQQFSVSEVFPRWCFNAAEALLSLIQLVGEVILKNRL